ncbi:hypothetical protein ACTID9_02885 [Brevibacillus fluminis]|uniref:hypothetical protein n=1 Tax=Brevibacillus fluminis TaxID=511487 RepID=UPI003F891E9D
MKKITSIVLSLSLCLAALGSVSAEGKKSIKAEDSADLNALFQRAKNNVTDVQLENAPKAKLNGNGSSKNIRVYTTTVRNEKTLKAFNDSLPSEEYTTYSFVIIPKEELEMTTNQITPYGSKDDDIWDSAYGLHAYSKYSWTSTQDINGLPYVKLTSCSGGWELADSSYTLSNRKVIFGGSGGAMDSNGIPMVSPAKKKVNDTLTSNTFSMSADSNWPAFQKTNASYGVITYIDYKRGTKTYTLQLDNQN